MLGVRTSACTLHVLMLVNGRLPLGEPALDHAVAVDLRKRFALSMSISFHMKLL